LDHSSAIAAQLADFVNREKLPPTFITMAEQWYWPLCRELENTITAGELKVLGISGTQGSGKSTLAALLQFLLQQNGLRVVCLSLDDFYLTRKERRQLADTVHPLLMTRGVPGTHDISLAISIIQQLFNQSEVKIPRFAKAQDDRLPESQWENIAAPVDLVIVEGWCLSLPPQTENQLQTSTNDLEKNQDADGRWRHFVNEALISYQTFFSMVDFLVYLQSPDFAAVKRWRGRQEQKLKQATKPTQGQHIMDEEALWFFLQHYQRLTLHSFATLPKIANVVFTLNDDQQITQRIDPHLYKSH